MPRTEIKRQVEGFANSLRTAVPLLLVTACSQLSRASHPAISEVATGTAGCSRQATAEALRDRGGRPGTSYEDLLFDLAVRERYSRCVSGLGIVNPEEMNHSGSTDTTVVDTTSAP
ncbi:hypothetical protein BH23GEM8_BH23GEM8_21130 [soil metagenome]